MIRIRDLESVHLFNTLDPVFSNQIFISISCNLPKQRIYKVTTIFLKQGKKFHNRRCENGSFKIVQAFNFYQRVLPELQFFGSQAQQGYKKLLQSENAGGSSIISEALSFEVLHRLFGCRLLATEMEIQYYFSHYPITDYAISVDGKALGVSVTRAMKWPIGSNYTHGDGVKLLTKKLSGVIKSTKNVLNPKFKKQILHVWAENEKTKDLLIDIWENNISDQLKSNTFVLITTAQKNCDYIFWSKSLKD